MLPDPNSVIGLFERNGLKRALLILWFPWAAMAATNVWNVVCWGDSLTDGWPFATNPYPQRVAQLNPLCVTANKGYAGRNSSYISACMLAESNAMYRDWTAVIWVGRNDCGWDREPYPATQFQYALVSNIQSMVNALENTNRFLVIGVLNGQNAPWTSLEWSNITACNVLLASAFAGHYLDAIATLQAAAVTPEEQAATNIGLWPARLCADGNIHLRDEGHAVIARAVHVRLLQLLDTNPVAVSPTLAGENLLLTFNTTNQHSYLVERNNGLAPENWVYHTNLIGNGLPRQVAVPVSEAPCRFFRVRKQ